ncbi:hypothetical protein PAXRUDRAFT_172612, partial [Paxillus rubicundulus Ve08.2h10]
MSDNGANCALDANGTLKDASEITFYKSETDEQPISLVTKDKSKQNSSSINQHTDLGNALLNSGAVPAQRVGGSCVRRLAWKLTSDKNVEASASKLPAFKRKRTDTVTEPSMSITKHPRPSNSAHSHQTVLSDDDQGAQ